MRQEGPKQVFQRKGYAGNGPAGAVGKIFGKGVFNGPEEVHGRDQPVLQVIIEYVPLHDPVIAFGVLPFPIEQIHRQHPGIVQHLAATVQLLVPGFALHPPIGAGDLSGNDPGLIREVGAQLQVAIVGDGAQQVHILALVSRDIAMDAGNDLLPGQVGLQVLLPTQYPDVFHSLQLESALVYLPDHRVLEVLILDGVQEGIEGLVQVGLGVGIVVYLVNIDHFKLGVTNCELRVGATV